MNAHGTFNVTSFVPANVSTANVSTAEPGPEPVITATPVGVALMEKLFEGDIAGRSTTLFVSAYDQQAGIGSYLAMESFEGSLHGRAGTFNFAHAASTTGSDRVEHMLVIVPASGTGELAGITGSGEITVDADGTHRIQFDYEL